MTGIPIRCTVCGARLLNPHELTGLCREDKLIARNTPTANTNTHIQESCR